MKIAVILMVAVVMMMSQEAESWKFWRRTLQPIARQIPAVRQVETGVRAAGRVIRSVGRFFRRWGKREVRDAEFDAALNAAIEDGILSDNEIQSVLGVSAEELTEFKDNLDMDGNGEISVAEYFVAMASASAEEEGQDDGQQ